MTEWWTYRPSDFLMFAPETYWRLVERYNLDVWPLQLLAVPAGWALWRMARLRVKSAGRTVGGVLAAAWLWVAWAFHDQRFSSINTAGEAFAIAFAAQAALLIALGALPAARSQSEPGVGMRRTGDVFCVAAILLYPLAGQLVGHPWSQVEVAGVMPDPTALLTMGLLLATPQRYRGVLMVLPVTWLVIGWGMLALF